MVTFWHLTPVPEVAHPPKLSCRFWVDSKSTFWFLIEKTNIFGTTVLCRKLDIWYYSNYICIKINQCYFFIIENLICDIVELCLWPWSPDWQPQPTSNNSNICQFLPMKLLGNSWSSQNWTFVSCVGKIKK